VFGLHANARVTRTLQDTRQLLDSLLLTQAQEGGGGGGGGGAAGSAARSPEDLLFAAAGDILDKLPPNFDTEAAQVRVLIDHTA
jgi:dynein heavy chain